MNCKLFIVFYPQHVHKDLITQERGLGIEGSLAVLINIKTMTLLAF